MQNMLGDDYRTLYTCSMFHTKQPTTDPRAKLTRPHASFPLYKEIGEELGKTKACNLARQDILCRRAVKKKGETSTQQRKG